MARRVWLAWCMGRVWRAWRVWLARLLWLGAALAAPAWADNCPPRPAAPTAEQLQTGLREARDRGLLWRIERDGRVGWLYGTLHLGRLAWAFPGPTLTAALRAADTVALELDPADPTFAPQLAAAVERLRQHEATQALPATLAPRLAALARAACLDDAALAAQPLMLQAMSLTVLAARHDALDPAYGQEAVLGGFARAAGKALVSLETVQAQFDALRTSDPADAARQIGEAADQLADGRARALLVRLAGLWERGDLAALAQHEQWCDCVPTAADRERMRRVNDGRNPALADRIEALHAQGRRTFAAVGALHMTGPQALPRLLAERGFQVQRVEFPAR